MHSKKNVGNSFRINYVHTESLFSKITLKNPFVLFVAFLTIAISSCKKDPLICDQEIVRGPYLQTVTHNSAIIKWKTCFERPSLLVWTDSTGKNEKNLFYANPENDHEMRIQGLQPSTKYYYQFGSDMNSLKSDSQQFFITAPIPKTIADTRIWIVGDAGSGYREQDRVRDAYLNFTGKRHTDVWLWLGDNAYEQGNEEDYNQKIFTKHYENVLKNICVWPAPGNHDYANVGYKSMMARKGKYAYFDIFHLPTEGEAGGVPSGTEHYYSFDRANIHFISLDSYGAQNDKKSEMYEWLEVDLRNNTQEWIIAYWHHPPYTKGSHDSDKEGELIDMRTNIVPLLESYGVDVVLSGHSHTYERSYFINGHYGKSNTFSKANKVNDGNGKVVSYTKSKGISKGTVYAVAGTSSKVSGVGSGWPHPAMCSTDHSTCGSMVIDVNGDKLTAKYVDMDGQVRDDFSIIKK